MSGEAYARTDDMETSHVAAAGMEGITASKIENIILNLLEKRGPLTMRECGGLLPNIPYQSITPRFAPLRRRLMIKAVGRRNGSTLWERYHSTPEERLEHGVY